MSDVRDLENPSSEPTLARFKSWLRKTTREENLRFLRVLRKTQAPAPRRSAPAD